MAKRPSLAGMVQPKQTPSGETDSTPETDENHRTLGKKDTTGVLVRVKTDGWNELRKLAGDLTAETGERHTLQSLSIEAMNDLLRKHGRPPLA